MTRVRHDVELGIRPDLGQLPRGANWRDDVIAAMDDNAWNALQLFFCLLQQPAIFREEALVHEIVALDAGEGIGEAVFFKARRA